MMNYSKGGKEAQTAWFAYNEAAKNRLFAPQRALCSKGFDDADVFAKERSETHESIQDRSGTVAARIDQVH